VLAAWEEAQEKGLGAVEADGRMVDRPIVERARRVVEKAEAAEAGPARE
jgi:citrate lyase subunit beta/citryl-CoA lyase